MKLRFIWFEVFLFYTFFRRQYSVCFRYTYTSEHDYLDAERVNCLTNTHWNTVWSNRYHRALPLFSSTACCGTSSSISNSMFPGLGFESQSRQLHVSRSGVRVPVKAIFRDGTPMATHINQSIKLFKKYSPLIDRGRKLGKGKKKPKKWSWQGFEPQTWKMWNLMWFLRLFSWMSSFESLKARIEQSWSCAFYLSLDWLIALTGMRTSRPGKRGI